VGTEPLEIAQLVEFSEARAYASLMQAAPEEFLRRHGIRVVRFDSAVAVVAPTVTSTLNMNRVIALGVARAATEQMVDEIVALYRSHDVSFGVELGPQAQPPELPKWLRKHQVRRGMPTAIHYRTAESISVPATSPTVVRAAAADRDVVARICCSVFRMPEAAHGLIAGTVDVPSWRQWLVYRGDEPVGAALSFVQDGVAWLGWDATLPEFRGHGAQSALIAHRVNDAVRAGCRYITTETAPNTSQGADPSYRNYQRLGFALAYERLTYIGVGGHTSS
jgi:GNAT superfamily N-acetyltransferase